MENIIDPTGCYESRPNLTSEEEIRYLKSDIRDLRLSDAAKSEQINRMTIQQQAFVDVMCDLRKYTKELETDARWSTQRMGDYRDALHDIRVKCDKVIIDVTNNEEFLKDNNREEIDWQID